MTFGDGVDIKEGETSVIFIYFRRRYFSSDNFAKYRVVHTASISAHPPPAEAPGTLEDAPVFLGRSSVESAIPGRGSEEYEIQFVILCKGEKSQHLY